MERSELIVLAPWLFDHVGVFEDETLVSDDYGVVDKADTPESRLWECHSDNGAVRQCSLPKGD